jgi:hypothetical protein
MFEWLGAYVPPEGLLLAGVVFASLRLTYLVGWALLAWVQSKARIAEIEASSRAEVAEIQEAGRVLLTLAEIAARQDAMRSRSLGLSVLANSEAGSQLEVK